ncbi:MAG: hypothetical protein ACI38B_01630 [Bifidobacterium sp.]|uniref:hypothetical protein n=1 Tax=Bifidobacterium sp. TaxID=41200 RepID=UPI003EFEA783
MDYEGVSAIVVLAVLILFIAGWLPTRTADSMKRVIRRRQDKYSPSLHLIDEHSGTRFSDGHSPVTKGAVMRPAQAKGTRVSHEHIAEVRRLRRASIRRRRIIACVLLLACVVVGVLSYLLRFSPLYVLIPAGFLVLTIALGARASRHARAWEAKVSKLLAQERRERTRSGKPQTAGEHVAAVKAVDGVSGSVSEGVEAAEHSAPVPADQASVDQTPEAQADAVETSLMEQQEIHRAVEQGMAERDRKLARRASRPAAGAETVPEAGSHDRKDAAAQGGQQHADAGAVRDIRDARGANGRNDAATQAATDDTDARKTQSAATAEPTAAKHGESAGLGEPGARKERVEQPEQPEPADQTLELSQVSPASSLDVFDMAAGRHQDLISFSWGAPRNIEEHAEQDAPESLEIKSTRQVAKAVPVKERAQEHAQGDQGDTPVNNAESFHHAESNAHVDVPEETTDSLGHDLRAVLQRRSS